MRVVFFFVFFFLENLNSRIRRVTAVARLRETILLERKEGRTCRNGKNENETPAYLQYFGAMVSVHC